MKLLKGLFQGKRGMGQSYLSTFLKGWILWGILLALHPLCAFGEESWTLWEGESRALGNVPVRSLEGRRMASILDAAALLGISGESQKGALVLLSGFRKASFVPGDVMVFVNGEIFPLTAPIRKEGNSWWAEVHGLLKVFDMVLHGSLPPPAPLTWKGGETGKGSEKPSLISPAPQASPEKTEEDLSMEAMLEKWRKDFAPSAASREGGDLRRLRWKEYPEKIRLVLDMAREEFPRPQESSGVLTLSFGTSLPHSFPGLSSPYPGKVTSSRGSESSLVFRHSARRIETFSLASPPRFVVDFFYDAPVSQKALPTLAPVAPKENPFLEEIIPEITSSAPKRTKPLVVLDPGHGGKDPGAVANGLKEKDINLAISKYLSAELQKRGYTVLLTRQDDRYLRLQERTDFANRHKADAFISVHVNALPKGRHAKGMEIYIMALPSDKDAMELAKIENREISESNGGGSAAASDARTEMLLHILGDMQQNAKIAESTTFAEVLFQQGKATGLPMRRVAQAPFFVLRGAGMPSVLLEAGFLTEKSEAKMLATAAYQRKIAQAFAEGIVRFLKNM
jgi:N-acetylmuramoyl-L-alanine amidase